MSSFEVPEGSDFPLSNLPYGIFSPRPGDEPRVGVAIGDQILDLPGALGDESFRTGSLNAFMASGPDRWSEVRGEVSRLLADPEASGAAAHLHQQRAAQLHMPIEVADYVDFYASEHHATNMGHLFRPGS